MDGWEAVLRLLAAAGLGGLIGFERESSDQPAGFRTHILVALGSALFTMVGAYGLSEFENDLRFRVDPTRIAAQVVTGIGFLGAGAILQKGIRVRGLTTAAALWVTAAIGMAAGLGYWPGAIGAAIISLIALAVLKALQQHLFGFVKTSAHLMFDVPQGWDMPRFEDTVRKAGGRIRKIEMSATLEGHRVSVTLDSPHVSERLAEAIADLPDISRLEWR